MAWWSSDHGLFTSTGRHARLVAASLRGHRPPFPILSSSEKASSIAARPSGAFGLHTTEPKDHLCSVSMFILRRLWSIRLMRPSGSRFCRMSTGSAHPPQTPRPGGRARPHVAEGDKRLSGLPESFVLEASGIVGALFQEPFAIGAPPVKRERPLCRLLKRADAHKAFGQGVGVDSCLGLRPDGGASLGLAERMDDASLDPGLGSGRPPGLLYAATVAGEHIRRCDARHETRPAPRALCLGQTASDDAIIGAGDEDGALSGEPDAILVAT